MVNKVFLITLSVLLTIFVISWTFNHINPWVAIGILSLSLYIAAKLIFKKQIKK